METDAETNTSPHRECAKAAIVCGLLGIFCLMEAETWLFGLIFGIMGLALAIPSFKKSNLGLSLSGSLLSATEAVASTVLLFTYGLVPVYV